MQFHFSSLWPRWVPTFLPTKITRSFNCRRFDPLPLELGPPPFSRFPPPPCRLPVFICYLNYPPLCFSPVTCAETSLLWIWLVLIRLRCIGYEQGNWDYCAKFVVLLEILWMTKGGQYNWKSLFFVVEFCATAVWFDQVSYINSFWSVELVNYIAVTRHAHSWTWVHCYQIHSTPLQTLILDTRSNLRCFFRNTYWDGSFEVLTTQMG